VNRQEAVDVLETIKLLYPKYEITMEKGNILITSLERMDYRLVMENLTNYVARSPFPPTIADIAAYPSDENENLEQMKKWREEAKRVPEEVKQRFHVAILNLVRSKSEYEDGKL
jgi:Loader and inhibitor of phage G40P